MGCPKKGQNACGAGAPTNTVVSSKVLIETIEIDTLFEEVLKVTVHLEVYSQPVTDSKQTGSFRDICVTNPRPRRTHFKFKQGKQLLLFEKENKQN
jgi:hypothetical protein